MDISVRNAGADDAYAIAAMENEYFSVPWSERQIAEEILKENGLFLVAEYNSNICGYISGENICGDFYMGNLAVSKAYRKKGVGTMLLSELISYAKNRCCNFVTLEVRKSNAPARMLYEKFNFTLVGERKNFYDLPKENACIYTLFF